MAVVRDVMTIDVGMRLRELREERNVSMRALARASGLSANALSMIERGLTSPSISTLNKLANALGVPITAIFRHEPQRSQVLFCKAQERVQVPLAGGALEYLGRNLFTGRMEACTLTLKAGDSSGSHHLIHSGCEFLFCLAGQLECEVDGQFYCLEPGDSLMFTAQLFHRFYNPGPTPAGALLVTACYGDDERPTEFHLKSANTPPEVRARHDDF